MKTRKVIASFIVFLAGLLILYVSVIKSKAESRLDELAETDSSFTPVSFQFNGHIGGASYQVAVNNGLVYVATSDELTVLDLSDPSRPQRVGCAIYPAVIETIYRMVIDSHYIYLACRGNGLIIFDITDPLHPTLTSFWQGAILYEGAVYRNYLYGSSLGDLLTIEISNPSQPHLISRTLDASSTSNLLAGLVFPI